MPTISVTVIGLLAALVFVVFRRTEKAWAVLLGVLGAWAGFVVGAVPGATADIVSGGGWALPTVGHLGAVVGAVAAVWWFGGLAVGAPDVRRSGDRVQR
ncbi:hypothetical protein [Gordonia neofelifaecis]|nr:hypothetical protein [Gordonia neofelifaecis]